MGEHDPTGVAPPSRGRDVVVPGQDPAAVFHCRDTAVPGTGQTPAHGAGAPGNRLLAYFSDAGRTWPTQGGGTRRSRSAAGNGPLPDEEATRT